jgi:hypothetical protein
MSTKQCLSCGASHKSDFTKSQWSMPLRKSRKCKSCQLEDQEQEQAWKEEAEDLELIKFFGLDVEDILELDSLCYHQTT